MVGAFAVNYTNSTISSANFTYARRGVVPVYVYVCNDWNFGNLYETSYGCNSVNENNLLTSSVVDGTWVSVNLTSNFGDGLIIGESRLNTRPLVKVTYGAEDFLNNVSIIKWGTRQSAYYAWVPIMQFNATAGRPYIASSGFADLMYYDVPMFQDPDCIELVALNFTVNLTFNGTAGITNLTYGPRYDSVNFVNESKLLPAWVITHEENFMGQTVNRTMLSPSFSPTGASVYYVYNNTTCGPYSVVLSDVEGKVTLDNATAVINYTCSDKVIYDYGGPSITLVDLPVANPTTLEALFSLAPPSFAGETAASLSSPIFVVNQTFSGGFIPGPEAGPPQPGTTTNISMVVEVNNSLTDWNLSSDANLYIHFLYPKNVTIYDSSGGIAFQASLGSNFKLYNKTGTSWILVANETWSEAGVVAANLSCNNMTDNLPGSPNTGNNMTLCFQEFDFNLSSVNNKWYPGHAFSNITLNFTASLNVTILSETTVPSGGTGTNEYNATISTASAGSINLYNKVPNINASDATVSYICIDGNCSTNRYNLGSFEVVFDQSGTHSVSIKYTRPTPTEEEEAPSPGLGLAPSTTVSTTPGKAVIYIPSIAAASKANVTIQKTEGVDFKEISITVINKVNAVYLTITKLDAKPTETPALVNVYRYIRVVPENIEDEDISEAKIKFKVNKTWINTNNIDEDTVALQRYTTTWNKLTTTKLSEDTEFVYYEAETPGFSYFTITGEEETVAPVCGNDICETGEDYTNCPADCPAPCVEDWTCTAWSDCVEEIQTRTCTDGNNCGTTVNKPIEEQSCVPVAPGIAVPTGLIIGIIVIVIAVLGVFFWKGLKPKRRK